MLGHGSTTPSLRTTGLAPGETAQVYLYDLHGRTVAHFVAKDQTPLPKLSPGVYLVRAVAPSGVATTRVVVR